MERPSRWNFVSALATGLLVCGVSAFSGCAGIGGGHDFEVERKTVGGLPTATVTDTRWVRVQVESIDYPKRAIALLGPDGKSEIYTVTGHVKNFNQIKKGDMVKAEYLKKVKATVRKVNEPPTKTVGLGMATAEVGQKPGVVVARKATLNARVESIDHATRKVRLLDEKGDITTITASAKLKDLDKVNTGDQVVFDYIEVVALYVE
jgi:hypothetical protein